MVAVLVGCVAAVSGLPPNGDDGVGPGASTGEVRIVRGGTAPSGSSSAVADMGGLMLLDVPGPDRARIGLPAGTVGDFSVGSEVLAGLILVRTGVQEVELGHSDGRRTVLRIATAEPAHELDVDEAMDPGGPPLAGNGFMCTGFSC